MPTTLAKAQDQIIETIELVQERVLDTNQKVAATLSERVPARISERLSDLPRPDLPQPAQAVDTYFGFVERVTKANHKFASEIVKVWTPAPAAEPKAEAAAAPAKKAPARKRAAKKAPARKSSAKSTK